jgi:hypothetical protein
LDVIHNAKRLLVVIVVLNAHTPTEGKSDDMKDSFYGELEHVFGKFPKYHTKLF